MLGVEAVQIKVLRQGFGFVPEGYREGIRQADGIVIGFLQIGLVCFVDVIGQALF